MNECREFIRFVTKGLVVVAAMQHLGFKSLNDKLPYATPESIEDKRRVLETISNEIIQQFVETERFTLNSNNPAHDQPTNRIPCGMPGCTKSFALDGKCRKKHRDICPYKDLDVLHPLEQAEEVHNEAHSASSEEGTRDDKLNYTCSLLKDGLLDWCRDDASKENDGIRLLRLWRFDLLRFDVCNNTKYRLLSFKLQAQVMALLPPRLVHQLLHNRSVNIHGGAGCNVPGDQALEFMNMKAKDALKTLHGNMTSSSIQRCGRSLAGCNDILDAYTKGLNQYFGKPSNTKPSLKPEIEKFVKLLTVEKLFEYIPGRGHKSFKDFNKNPLHKLDGTKLRNYLREKKEEYSTIQRLKSYYV